MAVNGARSIREPTAHAIPPFRERLRLVVPLLQPVVRAALVAGSALTNLLRRQYVALHELFLPR
jgi:hypothetical protein